MQNKNLERKFYDRMFSNLKGLNDGHCITYGYKEIYSRTVKDIDKGTILDVGCGAGKNSVNFAKMGFKVVGIDISYQGIVAARALAKKENQRILFVVGDVEKLPFKDIVFDTSFSGLILHHFPRLRSVAKEISRVTRRYLFAVEVNALDFHSFFKFNIINALIGHAWMSPNQRALFPKSVERIFGEQGFGKFDFFWIDIHMQSENRLHNFLRKLYSSSLTVLPEKYRCNKFIMSCMK